VAGSLRRDDVGREREGGTEGRHEARSVEPADVVSLDDEEAAGHRERRRRPHRRPQTAPVEEAQPQQDEHRAEVLDGQRNADVEPLDGQEIGGVHTSETGDPEPRHATHVLPADPQSPRRYREQHAHEDQPRDGGAQLREMQGRHTVVEEEPRQ
jgi:hypothetical protein